MKKRNPGKSILAMLLITCMILSNIVPLSMFALASEENSSVVILEPATENNLPVLHGGNDNNCDICNALGKRTDISNGTPKTGDVTVSVGKTQVTFSYTKLIYQGGGSSGDIVGAEFTVSHNVKVEAFSLKAANPHQLFVVPGGVLEAGVTYRIENTTILNKDDGTGKAQEISHLSMFGLALYEDSVVLPFEFDAVKKVTSIGDIAPKLPQTFKFEVEDNTGTVVATATATVEDFNKGFDLDFTFVEKDGYFERDMMYTLREVVDGDMSADPAWHYDQRDFEVKFDSSVGTDGELSITDGEKNYCEVIFENEYEKYDDPDPVFGSIEGTKTKTLVGKADEALHSFTIELYKLVDDEYVLQSDKMTSVEVDTWGKAVSFSFDELEPGSYQVKELIPAKLDEGWEYDTTVYDVEIDEAGKTTYSDGSIGFVNTYTVEEEPDPELASFEGEKAISFSGTAARPEGPYEFTFELYEEGADQPLATKTATASWDSNGKFSFANLESGSYLLKEKYDSVPEGWSYDSSIYRVTVDGTDVTFAIVGEEEDVPADKVLFENRLELNEKEPDPVVAAISASKTIRFVGEGAAPAVDRAFEFVLTSLSIEDFAPITKSVTMTAWGASGSKTVTFEDLAPGAYELKETIPAELPEGWAYDQSTFFITIDENGDVHYYDSQEKPLNGAAFENLFTKQSDPTPDPEKFSIEASKAIFFSGNATRPGGAGHTFYFELVQLVDGEEIAVETKSVTTTDWDAENAVAFSFSVDPGTYLLKEQAGKASGWSYDSTVYHIVVEEEGNITYTINGTESDPLDRADFENTYTSNTKRSDPPKFEYTPKPGTSIETTPTPIADITPGIVPLVTLPDPVTPAIAPELVILEPDVPLDVLPKTGYEDSSGKNGFFAALSMGLLTLAAALGLRKEEDEVEA